jgi:hypothetical protein
MYEPFTQTIINGFKSIDSSIVIEEQYGHIDFEKIQHGSMFIYVQTRTIYSSLGVLTKK